ERTALADAEVEYHDHVSPTVWVKFPVTEGSDAARNGCVVIWTTTPWTIPANRAVSYNPDIAYAVYVVDEIEPGLAFEPWAAPGHGADDYIVWLAHGHREIPETVDPDGAYYDHVPLFGGLKVLETEGKKAGRFGPANDAVIGKLIEAGHLLARGRMEHSYPHS